MDSCSENNKTANKVWQRRSWEDGGYCCWQQAPGSCPNEERSERSVQKWILRRFHIVCNICHCSNAFRSFCNGNTFAYTHLPRFAIHFTLHHLFRLACGQHGYGHVGLPSFQLVCSSGLPSSHLSCVRSCGESSSVGGGRLGGCNLECWKCQVARDGTHSSQLTAHHLYLDPARHVGRKGQAVDRRTNGMALYKEYIYIYVWCIKNIHIDIVNHSRSRVGSIQPVLAWLNLTWLGWARLGLALSSTLAKLSFSTPLVRSSIARFVNI